MDIRISDVFTPSQKQIEKNIFGSASLEIYENNYCITRLKGITLKKTKEGKYFLSMPSFKTTSDDGDKWLTHYSMFPLGADEGVNNLQKSRLEALTAEIVRLVEAGGTKTKTNSPQTKIAPVKSAPKKEPWNM